MPYKYTVAVFCIENLGHLHQPAFFLVYDQGEDVNFSRIRLGFSLLDLAFCILAKFGIELAIDR